MPYQCRSFNPVTIVIYCFALSAVAYVQIVFYVLRQCTMISQQWPLHHPFMTT